MKDGVGSRHLLPWLRSEHESLKILEKPFNIFQPGCLVFEATEPSKATRQLKQPCTMLLPTFGSLCQGIKWFPEADKDESKDAKERDVVVNKKSKRSTDEVTDKISTQAVWKKPEDKPGRIYLTRRFAQCEFAACEKNNHDKRGMAGKGKNLLAGLALATACPTKARVTRRAQARSAPRIFTHGCASDARVGRLRRRRQNRSFPESSSLWARLVIVFLIVSGVI